MLYNTKFIPPITDDSIQNRHPHNKPVDQRQTYLYLNYNRPSYVQTDLTNPNLFNTLQAPPKSQYFKTFNDSYHNPTNTTPQKLNILDKKRFKEKLKESENNEV